MAEITRPTHTVQSEAHVIKRRLTMLKDGVEKYERRLAERMNLIHDLEARLAELEGEEGND